MTHVYLNGDYLPLAQASVSVTDRGFLFGDGIYEVIPVYYGQLFRLEQHLVRLNRSLAEIFIELRITESEINAIAERLLALNQLQNASLYLQVTRGTSSVRDHRFPAAPKPTIYASLNPLPAVDERPDPTGRRAICVDDIRWQRCDIKAITLLANCMARQQAENSGADEALMVHDNWVIEGSASNLFMVRDNVVYTAPTSPWILGGITRELVLELLHEKGFKVSEQLFTRAELYAADEAWITSSTREIQPLVAIDGQCIGNGQAGPIWHQITEYYMAYKQKLYNGHIV
ncbi:MAG: D-amino acid aminotransferase [Gammaproteobacteria bacterium]|nr:D-amino acid aminotransferase [Gammaproteobacteria bacterium]NVK88545.1 D-amino acid aminotransferase [Gammaproteobacteria bacterium]